MNRTMGVILGVGAAVILLSLWFVRPAPPNPIANHEKRFLFCPHCQRESLYTEEAEAGECKRCGPGFELVATKLSQKELEAAGVQRNYLVPVFLLEINLLLAVVLGYLYFRRRGKGETEYLYTNCPRCDQKLRYAIGQVGRAGMCPRCKRSLVFPSAQGEDKAAGPWWKNLLRWPSVASWKELWRPRAE